MSTVKYINPINLRIARENIGLTTVAASKKVTSTGKDIVAQWEKGEALPTWVQVKRLSDDLYNVPELLFFSSDPIERHKTIPDYRIGFDKKNDVNIKKLINMVVTRQKWLERYVKEEGFGKNQLQGSGKGISSPKQLAKLISDKLEIRISDIKGLSRREDALKYLIHKAENKGIFIGKTVSYHKIAVDDMRGLFVSHDYCPFIVLNRKDSVAARIFSLVHELSHFFRKSDAVSNTLDFRSTHDTDPEEVICNRVAAELLLPAEEFTKEFYDKQDIDAVSVLYKVSKIFIFFRLKELGKIREESETSLENIIRLEMDEALKAKSEKDKAKEGGNYVNNMRDSNGALFNKIVQSSYLNNDMGYVEAANLLRFSPERL